MRCLALSFVLAAVGCTSPEATSSHADASLVPADDASNPIDAMTDAGILRCTSPLSAACAPDASIDCPPEFPDQLPGPWCAANPRSGAILGSCGGYTVLLLGTGTDGLVMFMYPADGGALAAVLAASDLQNPFCLGGAPTFALPIACFSDQGADLLMAFNGPGALPGCSTFDAGQDAAADAGEGGD
jgi:hypothetical protein